MVSGRGQQFVVYLVFFCRSESYFTVNPVFSSRTSPPSKQEGKRERRHTCATSRDGWEIQLFKAIRYQICQPYHDPLSCDAWDIRAPHVPSRLAMPTQVCIQGTGPSAQRRGGTTQRALPPPLPTQARTQGAGLSARHYALPGSSSSHAQAPPDFQEASFFSTRR